MKIVAITGGAQGIGRGVALRFARAGYAVSIADPAADAGEEILGMLRAAGPAALFERADTGQEADATRWIDRTVAELGCPDVMAELALQKRGIVLFVGATGTGKSTSMAAMIGYRNQRMTGHIITVEDPIEYVHRHGKSLVTQRGLHSDNVH